MYIAMYAGLCFAAFSLPSFSSWTVSLNLDHAIVTSYITHLESLSRGKTGYATQPFTHPMSLTPHPRKERPHGSKKVPARSSAGKSSLSRAVSEYPFAADPQGSVRTQRGRTSSDNGPRTFTRGIAVLFAGAVWASMSKSTKDVSHHPRRFLVNLMHSTQEWLSLVKDGKGDEEEGLMQAQYMMVCPRDHKPMAFIKITIHTGSRIHSPQLRPRVRPMALFQGWMAHTWWSALCNPSRVGNKLFTSPRRRFMRLLALNNQASMCTPGTATTLLFLVEFRLSICLL